MFQWECLKARNIKDLKRKVAEEAALLLYTEQEKEYKQAKTRAAKTLGSRVLPANREVANEVDRLAEEMEGNAKKERLIQMREEAMQIMRTLESFKPRLIGSVWRGTANKHSDIDILLRHSNSCQVLSTLQKNGYNITRTETQTTTKKGVKKTSFHIHLTLPSNNAAEIVVKKPETKGTFEKCEIYQDKITGLTLEKLGIVLKTNPLQTFIPT